jgi:hypothetical protein
MLTQHRVKILVLLNQSIHRLATLLFKHRMVIETKTIFIRHAYVPYVIEMQFIISTVRGYIFSASKWL